MDVIYDRASEAFTRAQEVISSTRRLCPEMLLQLCSVAVGLLCLCILGSTFKSSFDRQSRTATIALSVLEQCQRSSKVGTRFMMANDAEKAAQNGSSQNGASYSKKEVMLNVAKQTPSEAYRVQLPKGMEYPTLSPQQQVVEDRRKAALEKEPGKSDLDLLKEELQRIIDSFN